MVVNKEYIDRLMTEKGITSYPQLAKECNLHYTTLRYIFKGHNPGVTTLKSIADYFQVTVDSLLNNSSQDYLYVVNNHKVRKIKIRSLENIRYLMIFLLCQEG